MYCVRLAHWAPLYKHIHKQHHEWTAPIGVVSVYAHPVEHVMVNMLPFTTGAMLTGAHLYTILLW